MAQLGGQRGGTGWRMGWGGEQRRRENGPESERARHDALPSDNTGGDS